MTPGALLLLALYLTASSWAGPASKQPWRVPASARAQKNSVPPSPESIAKGRKLYQHHCLVCHGAQGAGDGPWVSKLPDPPGDLVDPSAMGKMTDGEIFWKISQGRNLMPGYARKLGTQQRWHLVNYLRTLARTAAGRNQ